MNEVDEQEYWRLQTGITQIEGLLANGGVPLSGATGMLAEFVQNAKKRLDVLEQGGQFTPDDEKRKKAYQETALIRYIVEKETLLNSDERNQYVSFLEKDYFSKSDFGSLENFYSKTWDKLSESGKAQMSHRVWEGVRQDEYDFSELPESVKKKEAERLNNLLSSGNDLSEDLKRIPEHDRDEFRQAWNSGKKDEAYQILDRPSFAQNVALTTVSVDASVVTNGRPLADRQEVSKSVAEPVAAHETATTKRSSADLLDANNLAALDVPADPKALPKQVSEVVVQQR